jgi:hypothetical protein
MVPRQRVQGQVAVVSAALRGIETMQIIAIAKEAGMWEKTKQRHGSQTTRSHNPSDKSHHPAP